MNHHNGRLFLLFVLLFGVVKLVKSTCDISPDRKYAYCQGESLGDVPQDLPEDLQYLDLSYNKINVLTPSSFSRYPHLDTLNLSYNNISLIENGTFNTSLLLRNLSLSNTFLEEIPISALEPLTGLEILDLSNNLYSAPTLGKGFYKLVDLQILSIGGPLVSSVLRDDFAILQNISLQKFSLKTKSNLDYYEPGAFSVLNTKDLWLDIALDNNPSLLRDMLKDLKGKNLTTLRFQNLIEDSDYESRFDRFSSLPAIDVKNLVFYRGKFCKNLLRLALQNVQISTFQSLVLRSVDFARSPEDRNTDVTASNLDLQNLVIKDITDSDMVKFDWTFSWFNKITHLNITNVNFNFVPCNTWGQMANIVTLNISDNRLLSKCLINLSCPQNVLPNIETFVVSNNQVDSLKTISLLTAQWPKLTKVDLSNNAIGSINESCRWNVSIKTLILRRNMLMLDVFQCLPITLEYLDMSHSQLERLDMSYFDQATNLTELILRNNKIKFIPTGWQNPNLQVLALEGNAFGVIDKGSFQDLHQLRELTAGNNPFQCTCNLNAFFTEILRDESLSIPDWPDNYYCHYPSNLLDTKIKNFSPGKLQCNVSLVVVIAVLVTAFVVIICMLLCYKLDVPWYLKATCQIIRSKYRSKKGQDSREYSYHAFISYSYSDADWVRGELLPHLENSNPPYRVCIHERDFLPGKWIIDNIIENIENSRKIIFVLSHNFVNSEWCNYELYFAHQRAVGHGFEDIILVVKENIRMENLPKRFCKLRKMLSTKTYLEWPVEENRQPFFWIQLKSILGKGDKSISGLDNNDTMFGVDSSSGEPIDMTTKSNLSLPCA
ncbi:toll-like receptor 2 [Leptodactylus fuscus]|uniref:toll-like receptor 2 n=1 Tax=Leptodactylus fuscus TaxID=238119 RepID=UPI003F4E70C9